MGTKSVTTVRQWDNDGFKTIVHIYRNWDGYPEGHGKDLCNYLKGVVITGGFVRFDNSKPEKQFGCTGQLASYLIYRLYKDGHEPILCDGDYYRQEFHYVVDVIHDSYIFVTVYFGPMIGNNVVEFRGSFDEYEWYIDKLIKEDEE